ncbi:MAG: trypsin-like peptidase domain-containing protein [Candidatus Berkelbacteria bacterium]|nr:trypsin-like peptidase domain-containing protein [Candidatus Berkelbacteria bacterium]
MAKIEFEEKDPRESLIQPGKKRKTAQLVFMILAVLLIFIAGGIGGVGGVLLFSADSGAIASKLGLSSFKNLTIPTTKTEKIVVEESSSIIDVANKVSNSVVSITAKSTATNIFGQTVEQQGAGTGFIITADGLILTNKHVVSDANATYQVIMLDGKTYDAKVQSLDPVNDLAVVKIDAHSLPVVDLGDSDQLKVGQWVVAVGNALGQFQNTVTAGIISAKDRKISASSSSGSSSSEQLSGLLQTDTAINSGNSGGPLVNLAGQVVGINTAVASNAQGIGFAIPINAAKSAIDSIKKTGRIIRPYIGVKYYDITPDMAKQYSLPLDHGAIITSTGGFLDYAVIPGSPADKAGLQANDIIESIDGQTVDEDHPLVNLIQQHQVGDTITLKVLSKSKEKDVKLTLEESK